MRSEALVNLYNVRVAGQPTFFPGASPDKHHLILTLVGNFGTSRTTQKEIVYYYTAHVWGKQANMAACQLDKGRTISVIGQLTSYTHPTGQVKNGKPELYRRNEIKVRAIFFGSDTLKELSARIAKNLEALRAQGLIPPNVAITPEQLLALNRPQTTDYNPMVSATTGMHGNARVFTNGAPAPAANNAAAPAANGAVDNTGQIAALEQQLNALKAGNAAQAANGSVDPMAGAV